MIITYTPKITPIYAETTLVPSKDIKDSVLFLQKEEGWLKYTLEYNDALKGVESVLEVEKLRNGYRLKTNTTNIIGTNKFDGSGQAFFNRITSNVTLTDELVAFATTLKDNGQYFTNEDFNNLEIQKGIFLYTEPVLYLLEESVNVSHEFTAKFIKISVKQSDKWVFKPRSSIVFEPLLLNAGSILLPSFYLEKAKYIEGNIRLIDKTEYLPVSGNILTPKDRVVLNKTSNTIFNPLTNSLYLDYYQLSSTNLTIQYLAKLSSHIFDFNNITLYLKLTPYMVEKGTAADHDIVITLEVDMSKISCIKSEYFTEYETRNNPQDIIFLNSTTDIAERDRVSFKNYIKADYSVFPSMVRYVRVGSENIYQHTNNHIIPQGISRGTFDSSSTNFNYTKIIDNSVTVHSIGEGVSYVSTTILNSIAIEPILESMTVGNGQQYTATGYYSKGITKVLQAAWSSNDPSIATVDDFGFVTPLKAGTLTITATFQGKTADFTVPVKVASVGNFIPITSVYFSQTDPVITFDTEMGQNNPTFTRTISEGRTVTVTTGSQFIGQVNVASNGDPSVRTLLGSHPRNGALAIDAEASAMYPVMEASDGANPTSPVLSGTPLYNGTISVLFSEDISAVALSGGYFDAIGATSIVCFDSVGNTIGQIVNSKIGVESFGISFGNAKIIRGLSFYVTGQEPAGFAIDNLQFK